MMQLRRRNPSSVNYTVVWFMLGTNKAFYYSNHERAWKPSNYNFGQVRNFTKLVGTNFQPKQKVPE